MHLTPADDIYLKGTLKFHHLRLQGVDVVDVVRFYRPLLRLSNRQYTVARFVRIGDNSGVMQLDHVYEVEILLSPGQTLNQRQHLSVDELLPVRSEFQIEKEPHHRTGVGVIDLVTTQPNQHLVAPPSETERAHPTARAKHHQQQRLDQLQQLPLLLAQRTQHLVLACQQDDTASAWAALQAGVAPQAIRKGATSPLLHAIRNGNLQLVAMLLHYGANINYQDWSGSALSAAVAAENEPMVRLLLDYGAYRNSVSYGFRPENDENSDLASMINRSVELNEGPSRKSRIFWYFLYPIAAAIVLGEIVIDVWKMLKQWLGG